MGVGRAKTVNIPNVPDMPAKTNTKKLCCFSYYGGKFIHLNWLLPVINNVQRKCFVDVYGGSASIILNVNPVGIEIYNDINSDITNFFKVLRDDGERLIKLLELTPYSREEFKAALRIHQLDSDLEKARKFFVIARQVRSGLSNLAKDNDWSWVKGHIRRNMSSSVSKWLTGIDMLPDIVKRLKLIQIENDDALNIIDRYDSKETLFYLDPTYLEETRKTKNTYKYEMTQDQHIELLDKIRSCQGKFILSGYNNHLYNSKLNNWTRYEGKPRQSPASNSKDNYTKRQESIWVNFCI